MIGGFPDVCGVLNGSKATVQALSLLDIVKGVVQALNHLVRIVEGLSRDLAEVIRVF